MTLISIPLSNFWMTDLKLINAVNILIINKLKHEN